MRSKARQVLQPMAQCECIRTQWVRLDVRERSPKDYGGNACELKSVYSAKDGLRVVKGRERRRLGEGVVRAEDGLERPACLHDVYGCG